MTGKTSLSTSMEYMPAKQASAYAKISTSKLAKLRMRENRGVGPQYIKVGGTVLYRRSDLDAWLDAHLISVDQTDAK